MAMASYSYTSTKYDYDRVGGDAFIELDLARRALEEQAVLMREHMQQQMYPIRMTQPSVMPEGAIDQRAPEWRRCNLCHRAVVRGSYCVCEEVHNYDKQAPGCDIKKDPVDKHAESLRKVYWYRRMMNPEMFKPNA